MSATNVDISKQEKEANTSLISGSSSIFLRDQYDSLEQSKKPKKASGIQVIRKEEPRENQKKC